MKDVEIVTAVMPEVFRIGFTKLGGSVFVGAHLSLNPRHTAVVVARKARLLPCHRPGIA
jgi:hypothetical protein